LEGGRIASYTATKIEEKRPAAAKAKPHGGAAQKPVETGLGLLARAFDRP
jgi:hypothetical protein